VDQLRDQGRQPAGAEPGQPWSARAGLASRSGQARADPGGPQADQGRRPLADLQRAPAAAREAARRLGSGKRQCHKSRQDHHGGEHDGEGKRVVPAAGGVCVARQRPAVRAPVSGHGARAAGESFLGLGQGRGRAKQVGHHDDG